MMRHHNQERDDHRSSTRHHRQEIPHITTTTHRTQPIAPSAKHTMDRYSLPIDHIRSGGYGKCLD
jgi:hypothetical protein